MSDLPSGIEEVHRALRRGRYVVAFGAEIDHEPVLVTFTLPMSPDAEEYALHDDPDTRAAFAFGVIRAFRKRARQEHGCAFP